MDYPLIVHDNRFADATPVASSTAAGDAANLADFRPYTIWQPSAMPATITVDCGVAVAADCLALFNHTSHGATYEVHGSDDDFESEDVISGTYWAETNDPAILQFTSASHRFWRLKALGCENLFTYSEQFDNAAWTKTASSIAADTCPAPLVSHESNLFLYSEQFDNAYWTKTRASITPDAVMAPNGELTADALIEDGTAANSHFLNWNYTPVKGKRYTQSVYAKAKTGSRGLYMASGSAGFGVAQLAHFNIDTGAVISSAGGVTTSIESVGDGWYRCAMTTVAATAAVAVSATNFLTNLATTTYNGDGVSGLYLWGAQLEDDATLSRYKQTTTAAVTITSEADALIEDTSVTTSHNIYRQVTSVYGERYAFSVYVKSLSGDRRVTIQANSGGFAGYTQSAIFNLTTGVISGLQGGATTLMEPLDDGWYRCSLLTIPAIASTATVFVIYLDNGTAATYTGNGTSGVYLFGAQLEQSPNPSDYIKTTTAAAENPPVLSVAAIGAALQMPKGVPYGFDPLMRDPKGQLNVSEHGLPLGKNTLFEEWAQMLNFQNVLNTWLRATFLPIWKADLRDKPFLLAIDLTNFPDEIYLVEATGALKTPSSFALHSHLQFNVKGVAL